MVQSGLWMGLDYTWLCVGCSMIRPFSADCSVKVPVYLSYGAEAAEKYRIKTKPEQAV